MKRQSMLPTPEDLTFDQIQSHFGTDDAARAYLEAIRWEFGVFCPHCKNDKQKRIWKIEENAEKKKHTLETLAEGKVLKGVVKNITDYGAFIDLGGIDGLLHITDMSWGRVGHPSELFKVCVPTRWSAHSGEIFDTGVST